MYTTDGQKRKNKGKNGGVVYMCGRGFKVSFK